jgi:hypothetical protein
MNRLVGACDACAGIGCTGLRIGKIGSGKGKMEMFKRLGLIGTLLLTLMGLAAMAPTVGATAVCTPTGFVRDSIDMTAAKVNPTGTVSGNVDATGCNIGVYYDHGKGSVSGANIHGANYFGVVVNGDANSVSVDVTNSTIHDIGEMPLNGDQHGIGVYYRAAGAGTASGKIWNNTFANYQKGGIVTNFSGTHVSINDNTVTGQGPVGYIAQNGIQVGYGADASVMRNTVTGNSYTGSSTVSGGIIVVGGPGYGEAYTVGTQIVGNTVVNNDVGIFLTNLAADGSAPATATNVKAINNTISDNAVTNGLIYQAGVSDVGNNDKIINNTISGAGYDPATVPGSTFAVDADASFANRAKVHANK